MEKWADYLISGVKTNPNLTLIDSVEVHSDFNAVAYETLNLSRTDIHKQHKKRLHHTVYKTKTANSEKTKKFPL